MALKPIQLDSQTTCVFRADPAVDNESEEGKAGVEAYVKVMHSTPSKWRELLKIKAGESPTVFVIGVLPSSDAAQIQDEYINQGKVYASSLGWLCFLKGIRDIQGFGEVPKVKVDGVEYVDPAFLRKAFVGRLREAACEIGWIVWRWNQISEDEIKN
jgi:hypothetical protein